MEAIYLVGTASFLEIGTQPPAADWALMVRGERGRNPAQPVGRARAQYQRSAVLSMVRVNLAAERTGAESKEPDGDPTMTTVLDIRAPCHYPHRTVRSSVSVRPADAPIAGQIIRIVGAVRLRQLTTLLRADQAGADCPSRASHAQGSLTVLGMDVLALPAGELRAFRRRHIGFVGQDPASRLNPAHAHLRQVCSPSVGPAQPVQRAANSCRRRTTGHR